MDKCPGDKCPIKFLSQLFYSVYGQTHSQEAQLWGQVSPQIPHYQKNKKSALTCKACQVHGQFAHKLHGS